MGCRKKRRIFSVWGSMDNVCIFPFYLPFLVTQLLFQQLDACPALCPSQLPALLVRACWTHCSQPCSQSIFPWLLLGNSVVRDRKGDVPVDYAHRSQPLKIRHTETAEPMQSRNSAACPTLCMGLSLGADQ